MAASLWLDEPGGETGYNDSKKEKDELLVFGYASKLFRDDERANDIDNGKLLIPWMGDESLMIDRYDGRGHLYDLSLHDADRLKGKKIEFSEEELAVEEACDKERYMELHKDLREEAMYEEEEWKRYYLSLQEGYKAVGFSYDYDQQQASNENYQSQQAAVENAESEKPFIVPDDLKIPGGMLTPTCKKIHARIEKTANFIAKHGIQMEIMLKTKQSGNSQFDFLHFEHNLNPYYQHVVSMIKSGKYKPVEEDEADETADSASGHQGYLHPSLSSTQLPPPPPKPSKPIELPKVSIHDTPYGALIKSIKKNFDTNSYISSTEPAETSTDQFTDLYVSGQPVSSTPPPPPPGTQPIEIPMVSSLNGKAFIKELYGPAPRPKSESKNEKRARRRRQSSSSESSSGSDSSSSSDRSRRRKTKKRSSSPKMPVREEGPRGLDVPPPDIEPIVDRMAMYVAKNGPEFEMVVMSRNDARFQFLNQYHVYYPYYNTRKQHYIRELEKDKDSKDSSIPPNLRSVSFSIKTKSKEQDPTTSSTKLQLFQYDSEEGEEHLEPVTEPTSRSSTPVYRQLAIDEDSQSSQKEIEEKLKDKLANAAKERVHYASKEKNLQAERKKKAAMFLNLLKTGGSKESSPPVDLDMPPVEDASVLYVGEGDKNFSETSSTVYDYDNYSSSRSRDRSRSPRKRRRRSPTPPSAYNLDTRPTIRPIPGPRWQSRGSTSWSSFRERDSNLMRKRNSRSPHRKDDKKKKHKKSRSRTPSKKDKKEKTKDRSKHKDKKKKHKSKEKSRSSKLSGLDNDSSDWSLDDVDPGTSNKNGHSSLDLDSIPIPAPSTSSTSLLHSKAELSEPDGSHSASPFLVNEQTESPDVSNDLMSKVRAMLKKSREMAD